MTSNTATRPSVTATLNALVAGQEVHDWTALSASEQAHVRRVIRKRGGQVRATKGVAHAEGLEGDGIVAALTPAPEPTPVPAEPEAEKSDPEPTAPAEELIKVRTGHRVLTHLIDNVHFTTPAGLALVQKARTSHRYKDGCSVLELTADEAQVLRQVAATLVRDTDAPSWNRGAEIGAKAVLRWLDAAGITG